MLRVFPACALWEDCSGDFLGPLATGESITVVGDYFRRFVVKSIIKAKVIEEISPIFARFGVTFSLQTDNGPQRLILEFQSFLRMHDNWTSQDYTVVPQDNGEVEHQNRSLLECLQVAHWEKNSWRSELISWLTAHRSAPQVTCGTTPLPLMFGREMRTKLPELRRETKDISRETTRDRLFQQV